MAGAASLVDSVDASSGDALTPSEQRDDQLAANSTAATYFYFIEDMDLSNVETGVHNVLVLVLVTRS